MLDPHLEICVENECERIMSEVGRYPLDWMTEIAENAQENWTEGGFLDYDAAEDEITGHADQYIYFMKENYPEEVNK